MFESIRVPKDWMLVTTDSNVANSALELVSIGFYVSVMLGEHLIKWPRPTDPALIWHFIVFILTFLVQFFLLSAIILGKRRQLTCLTKDSTSSYLSHKNTWLRSYVLKIKRVLRQNMLQKWMIFWSRSQKRLKRRNNRRIWHGRRGPGVIEYFFPTYGVPGYLYYVVM
jgi:hypothetical protein